MSVVNNALSKLAEKKSSTPSELIKAEVPELPEKSSKKFIIGAVLLGGVALAALTLIPNETPELKTTTKTVVSSEVVADPAPVSKPVVKVKVSKKVEQPVEVQGTEETVTVKPAASSKVKIYSAPQNEESETPAEKPKAVAKPKTVEKSKQVAKAEPKPQPKPVAKAQAKAKPQPKPVAKAVPIATVSTQPANSNSQPEGMAIEQVELTPRQLADKSIERANKAVESNDLKTALNEYTKALRFVPSDSKARRKLAALYYGKRQVRKAVELLQQGIKIDEDDEMLRISLSKLLIKEKQTEAALSPLIHIPENVSNEYMAMRAGISQQVKNTEVALESYLSLVEREPENGRWWLGLGIQQERALQFDEAKISYDQALNQIGISNKSKSFIRQRLELIATMGDVESGN